MKPLETAVTNPNQQITQQTPTMKKTAIAATLVASALFNVSCSNLGTDSTGRRYSMSPMPIQSKTGLTYVETRPSSVASGPEGRAVYHHSPSPIASKTGLQVAYAR
jgi:hypothetical protein